MSAHLAACRKVTWSEIELAAFSAVGMTPPGDPGDAVIRNCQKCGAEIYVGPRTLNQAEACEAVGDTIVLCCIACAAEVASIHRELTGDTPKIVALNNPNWT